MRFLHTMIRVNNLDETVKFYCESLGMKLLRRKDYPGGEFTLAFVGYGGEADNTVIELTHNWKTTSYDLGHLRSLRQVESARRESGARARTDEAWRHGDRVYRGSQRLQD
jgi:lactoylglutathione lyase